MQIFGWITSLFRSRTYQSSVEDFLNSKRPTSVAEIEMWIKAYDRAMANNRGWI
jgi:hypothetical protein